MHAAHDPSMMRWRQPPLVDACGRCALVVCKTCSWQFAFQTHVRHIIPA
jgi:hypothetical protein